MLCLYKIPMNKPYSNPCTRCGKERIQSKQWTEKIPTFSGGFIEVIHTENICPDPECQAIVAKDLAEQKAKRDKFKKDREEKQQANIEKKRKEKEELKKTLEV